MIEAEKYSYKGMMQDLLKSKFPNTYYFKGRNIRISNADSGNDTGITNSKGNEFALSIPSPVIDVDSSTISYDSDVITFVNSDNSELTNGSIPANSGTQVIIGSIPTRDSFIIFSTDDNGFDCVWDLDIEEESNNFSIKLLYARNLGFSTSNPIQAVFNYENTKVQKVYWVDGENQLRFINTQHKVINGDKEELIDVNSTSINIVGEFEVSQPKVTSISGGGTHTSGVIQYAYNLYRINGAQTAISPISEEVPLGKGALGGGKLNEIVGESPIIEIDTLDVEYTHIKLYAIKYTSFGELPSVSIIVDENIPTYKDFQFYDTGAVIRDISLSEFLFLGGNPILPKHIAIKYNILFAANIVENQFIFDIDARAFSHNTGGDYTVYDNLFVKPNGDITGTPFSESNPSIEYKTPIEHDSINIDFDTYKYQANGSVLGGEGKFLKYELVETDGGTLDKHIKYYKFFKGLEIYRLGIQFYNKLGQISFPKWVADFKASDNNLNGIYNTLKVTVNKSAIDAYITSEGLVGDDVPVGYRVLRATRDINDKSIICQGALTGMMTQTTNDVQNYKFWKEEENREEASSENVKVPWLFTREFNANTFPFEGAFNLSHINEDGGSGEGTREIYTDNSTDYKRQQSWLYTKMFQMHSPDILFNSGVGESSGMLLRVRGLATDSSNNTWFKRIKLKDLSERYSDKLVDTTVYRDWGNEKGGLVGPSFTTNEEMRFALVNKKYSSFESNVVKEYNIKGKPEATVRGQGIISYNGDSSLQFSNTLTNVITDKKRGKSEDDESILSLNSYGEQCLTIVEDKEKDLYDLYNGTSIGNTDGIIIAELVKSPEQILLGNMYGGNTYERKLATEYVEIGEYSHLEQEEVNILSPGDTYVGNFKVARIAKTDVEVLDDRTYQLTELLEFPSESNVNLYNRDDTSVQVWDSKFQPRYDEYHSYNRVYSTQPSIVERVDKNFKFKSITEFDTRIMASKTKIPGEPLDSWTDFLDNEELYLEGKYGDINALISSNNEIFALQDSGVAKLSISPNVQVQGTDGISIELGKGSVLYDYKYVSSFSGTLNKWSVITSPSGFYYYDVLNKSIMAYGQGKVVNLSNMKGFRTHMVNNTSYSSLVLDNPILKSGVTGVFNTYDKMMYMTFLSDTNSFTISFSEPDGEFDSFWDFTPSIYLQKGFSLLTTDSSNNSLYKHGSGNRGEFYNEVFPSSITLLAAPRPDFDKTFNNLMFKSECYEADGTDMPSTTIDSIKVWNEHQNTGEVVLTVGRKGNINRKFRKWSLDIPKIPGTRQRIRNPWTYIELGINNLDNRELVLHDILLNYTL